MDQFNEKIKWRINNGESISFWKGNWSDLRLLASCVPRLHALSCCQNGCIKENWDQIENDWNFQPGRPFRYHEIQQYGIIAVIPTPNANRGKDFPIGSLNPFFLEGNKRA